MQVGEIVGKKTVQSILRSDAPSELKQNISSTNQINANNASKIDEQSRHFVFALGYGGIVALILGLGVNVVIIFDLDLDDKSLDTFLYGSGSIGCGMPILV